MKPTFETVAAIADHLEGWSALPPSQEHYNKVADFVHERTGCTFSAHAGSYGMKPGFIEFCPDYNIRRELRSGKINCNSNRGAKAIAADVKRRLLAGYLEAWQKTCQEKLAAQAAKQKELVERERLKFILQGYDGGGGGIHSQVYPISARDTYRGQRLEISVPPEHVETVALALVGLCKTLNLKP